jgi:hypothetical protein
MRRKLTKCGTAVIVSENDCGWLLTQNYWGPSIQCDSCLELYEADPPSSGFGNNGGFVFDPLSREVKKTPFLCENCKRITPEITIQKYS